MSKSPHHSEDDAPKKKRRGASVMAWVLMAMLIGGLGSFGVTNFGGGVTAIGSVGDREIDVNDYARALRQQMNAFSQQIGQPIGFAQMQALGLDRQVLQSVIDNAALDNEADRIGLSVGDATVAAKLAGIASFQNATGGFDRVAYGDLLRQNNLTEAGFESGLRAETARQILETTVSAGFIAPAALVDTVTDWAGETRDVALLRLTEAQLPSPLPAAGDAELQAWYDGHIAAFTRPEAKRITYVTLLPEAIAAGMAVDEARLKETYQTRIAEFVIPEKRLVERLAFATEAEAAAARARIDAGESFDTLVAERQLTLDDVDMGDVAKADLGAAGEAVFALAGPGVVGPLPSDIGPALYRMNAVLAAQETSFDEARAQLALEVQLEAARRAIADKVETIDDLLAGGATLEDLARDQGMTLATTDYAAGADDNDAIADYTGFREAADALAEGDFPQAIVLDDGGVLAITLDEIVPPTPRPFAEVKDQVAEAAHAEALATALAAEAERIRTAVAGGAALGGFGITARHYGLDRQAGIADTPAELMAQIFALQPGDVAVVAAAGFTGLIQLEAVTPADRNSEDATALREAIAVNAARAMSADAVALLTTALMAEAGITLDQAAINAVHAQMKNAEQGRHQSEPGCRRPMTSPA